MMMLISIVRAFFRLIGLMFYAMGLACLGFFAGVFMLGGDKLNQSLGQVWFQQDPFAFLEKGPSIQLVQVFIERKLMIPPLWSPGITTLLNWPSWMALLAFAAIFIVVGIVLFGLTRKRAS